MNLIEIEKTILTIEFNLRKYLLNQYDLEKIVYSFNMIINSKIFSSLLPGLALNCGRYDIYKKYKNLPLDINRLIFTDLLVKSVIESSQHKEQDVNISNLLNTLIPLSTNIPISKTKLKFIDQLISGGYAETRSDNSLLSQLIVRKDYSRVKQLLVNGSDVTLPIIASLIHNDIKAIRLIFKFEKIGIEWEKIKRQFYDKIMIGQIRGIGDIQFKTILVLELKLGRTAFPELEIKLNQSTIEDTLLSFYCKKYPSLSNTKSEDSKQNLVKFLYSKI